MTATNSYDLLVIGGGINGAGVARDAAGRGLSVLLVEQDDLASATSSWSSKLVHGGLRYLEQYEFRLVREALEEREVLMRVAPHLVHPLRFVLPHAPGMRPFWFLRLGVWLYDRLGHRVTLPGGQSVRFPHAQLSAGLKSGYRRGLSYFDCRVDDARLTVINAMGAREKGATIRTRTRFVSAQRVQGAWSAQIEDVIQGKRDTVQARAIVNAAGPWVMKALASIEHRPTPAKVRLVKGSHIVVPRIHGFDHAYTLQNPDKRIVFVIPYEEQFSLIGTTDVAVDSPESARDISAEETRYLLESVNRWLTTPLAESDIVWSYAGVRPLYDDGSDNPSAITRDYTLVVEDEGGAAPAVNIFGGKITTYRCLAESVMEKLQPYFPAMGAPWTGAAPLPGGETGFIEGFIYEFTDRLPHIREPYLTQLISRHGTRVGQVIGNATTPGDLGRDFGAALTEREIDYLIEHEWARTAEDILWRRTKCGLHLSAEQRAAVADYVSARVESRSQTAI
jgi:glycerol-3-phosphate dehydrogenase